MRPMRRQDRAVTDPEKISAVIGGCQVLRLGLQDGKGVYVVPVNFGHVLENGRHVFYIHGAGEGRKVDLVRQNGWAGFELDAGYALQGAEEACGYTAAFRSVIGEGPIRVVEDGGGEAPGPGRRHAPGHRPGGLDLPGRGGGRGVRPPAGGGGACLQGTSMRNGGDKAMQIFPAIDLRGGQVVRLYQGDYDRETVYAQDPCAVARDFIAAGARYLHVVDLDGARDGTLANFDAVAAIAEQGGLYIEVGGGIRDEDRIRRYLDLGVGRCILGTIAVKDFAFTERMAEKYGDRIAVGVDARDGYVAVSGWKELSAEKGVDFCRRLRDAGVKTVIYTDISRDGAEAGTNLDLYRELAEIDGLDITASGGVSSIEELKELQRIGTKAAILGKALYTGRLDLKTVIREVGAC